MATILKGAPAAAALTQQVLAKSDALRQRGVVPTLAIVRVGENPADLSYERGALKRMAACNIETRQIILPADATQADLTAELTRLNGDASVHGVLLFRPLPKPLSERAAAELLSPDKDVDGFTPRSMSGLYGGTGEGFAPCTAAAVLALLDHYGVDPAGKRIAVVGRSLVIGKPVAMLLIARNATVTVCHTKTRDLPAVCREADILVAAAGRARLIGESCVSPGQTVIDVGVNVDENGALCGDVDFDAVEPVVSAVTPVPGGVGGVTTSVLAMHVVESAARANPK